MSQQDKWVIVGRDKCPWCRKAEQLLDDREIDYIYTDLHFNQGLKWFFEDCGLTTVPQVYLNGNRIGGYEALQQHFELQDKEQK